jgi:hypothetical protein
VTGDRLDQRVNVIGHDGPSNHAITLAIKMKQGILDDSGDLRSPQPAVSRSSIKEGITIGIRYSATREL